MISSSRRRFLGAAGAGAAVAGATAVAPTAFAGQARRSPTSAEESVVAYVDDPSSDTVTLLVGEREVVVHDRDLATRLLNAAGR